MTQFNLARRQGPDAWAISAIVYILLGTLGAFLYGVKKNKTYNNHINFNIVPLNTSQIS